MFINFCCVQLFNKVHVLYFVKELSLHNCARTCTVVYMIDDFMELDVHVHVYCHNFSFCEIV